MTGTQFTPTMPPLSEAQVAVQVVGYLRARGWEVYRMQRALVQGPQSVFVVGEPGVPDWQARYYTGPRRGEGLTLWVEIKNPNDRRKCTCLKNLRTRRRCTVCDQKNWKEREIRRGGEVWTVDDFASFEQRYLSTYGWLHSGPTARGQLALIG